MINKDVYDVIVIGAGPAGSMAAYYSKKNGANSVLLLERDREIGVPVRCGEAVSEMSLKKFVPDIDFRWVATIISEVRFVSPNGYIVDAYIPGRGFILNRRIFDHYLANEASNIGVEVLTRANVREVSDFENGYRNVYIDVLGEKYTIKGRIVIAADGVESRIARMVGINTYVQIKDMESCVQMHLGNINVKSNRIEFYLSKELAPGGYLWVFPKGKRDANVGLGISGDFSNSKHAIDYLTEFVKNRFPGASILTIVAGGVPCTKPLEKLVGDGFIVIGDAARQVNPMTGGGISLALASGKMAGELAGEAIKENDCSSDYLMRYQKNWLKKYGGEQKRYYRLKEFIRTLEDQELDDIAKNLFDTPPEKVTLTKIFTLAVRRKPSLLVDVAKVFAGL
ncbi:MAG: NAD(P)/FAD-dependent oxidoreductase [Candidatus Marinimicrobia bacterium]|nr:NAD(P)/FAD-dependent oxidoreductase [Candidatus Neomarinimicrobiota bacterium]